MIALLAAAALAGEGHVDVLAGVRTAPDAALEQPSEWEYEVEPTAVAAVVAGWRSTPSAAWWGLEGGAWGMVPEEDASLLTVGPRAGVGASAGAARLELAGRYDAQWFPASSETSSGRAEALVEGKVEVGALTPELGVTGIDRHYPFQTEWSFRTFEPHLALTGQTADGRLRLRGTGGFQWNRGFSSGTATPAGGAQIRLGAELGLAGRRGELWGRYVLIEAWDGSEQPAARPVFTPVGDYAEDADALSGGGFLQHRVELGASAEVGAWTVRGSALARLREADAVDLASFERTVHGQLDVRRELSERLTGIGTVGASGASLVSGTSYIDVYGWAGVSVGLGGDP